MMTSLQWPTEQCCCKLDPYLLIRDKNGRGYRRRDGQTENQWVSKVDWIRFAAFTFKDAFLWGDLDHGASKEPVNPWPEGIHRFIWCTIWSRQVFYHWFWSRSTHKERILSQLTGILYCTRRSKGINQAFALLSCTRYLALFYSLWQTHLNITFPLRHMYFCILLRTINLLF